ncbi:unnamed protein product, partial [Prorocentrum cordatum]
MLLLDGGFCQNAIEGAQQDLELTIETQLREKQVYADRLRLLFEEMTESSDLSEGLTAAEIHFQLAKPKVQSWFKSAEATLGSGADAYNPRLPNRGVGSKDQRTEISGEHGKRGHRA